MGHMTMRKLLPLVFVVGVIKAIRVDEDPQVAPQDGAEEAMRPGGNAEAVAGAEAAESAASSTGEQQAAEAKAPEAPGIVTTLTVGASAGAKELQVTSVAGIEKFNTVWIGSSSTETVVVKDIDADGSKIVLQRPLANDHLQGSSVTVQAASSFDEDFEQDMVNSNQTDDGPRVAALVKANKDQVKAQQATRHQAAAQVVAEKRARNAKRLELKAMAEKELSEKLQGDAKKADLLASKEYVEAQEATGKAEKAHLWERMLTKAHQSSEKDVANSAQQEEMTEAQEEDMRRAREVSAAKGEKEDEKMKRMAAMSDYYSKRSADTALTVEKAKETEAHAHKVAVDKHAARDVLEDQMLRAKEKAKHSADELAKANEALQTTIEENEETADGAIEDYTAAMDAAVTADSAAKDAQEKAAAEKAAYAAVITDQAVTHATKAAAVALMAGDAIRVAEGSPPCR